MEPNAGAAVPGLRRKAILVTLALHDADPGVGQIQAKLGGLDRPPPAAASGASGV